MIKIRTQTKQPARSRQYSVKPHSGFTVIELITVMLVLAILSIGTVRFMSDSTQGFVSASERAELAADARVSIQRLNRELREALPNSLRISGDCLEYIPIHAASVYRSAPVGFAGQTLNLIPFVTGTINATDRLSIAPGGNLYELSTTGSISPTFTLAAPNADNIVVATLTAAHNFTGNSAQRRIYVIGNPISYCLTNNALWRYQDYGFRTTQPIASDLPTTAPARTLLVERLNSATSAFSVTPASLTRNAVIDITLDYQHGADTLAISHTIQLRNLL